MNISRKTIDLFLKFMTSQTGAFLKEPLVHELAEAIDGMASIGENNLLHLSRGLIRPLPGGNGPVNTKRMDEMIAVADVIQSALVVDGEGNGEKRQDRMEFAREFAEEMLLLVNDEERRGSAAPILSELTSVIQMVAVEVLEIRSSRAIRRVLGLADAQ